MTNNFININTTEIFQSNPFENKKIYYIYLTTNLINGKIYIGQRTCQDPSTDKYLGSGTILKKAIKRYGKENFHKEILYFCNDKKEMDEMEIWFIEKYNARDQSIGYNIHIGGNNQNGENNSSYDSKSKKVVCIETGQIFISAQAAARYYKLKSSGVINQVCRGKKITSAGLHWKYLDESLEAMEPNRIVKKVHCLTNNIIYKSIDEATKMLNIDRTRIRNVCRNKSSHASGFVFKYLDNDYKEFIAKNRFKVMCLQDGRVFSSAKEASKYYNICVTNILKIIKGIKVYITDLTFVKI